MFNSLQSVYGTPGETGTLETAFNGLTSALQALSTNPGSQSARLGVVGTHRRWRANSTVCRKASSLCVLRRRPELRHP